MFNIYDIYENEGTFPTVRGSTICKQHVILTGVPRGSTGWTWRAARGATAGLKTRWRLVQRLNTAAVSIRYWRLVSLLSGLTDSGFDFIPPMESSPLIGWLTDGSSNHLPGTFWKCVRSSKQFFWTFPDGSVQQTQIQRCCTEQQFDWSSFNIMWLY